MASAAAAPAPAPAEGEARPVTPSSGKRPPSRRMPPLDTAKKRAREEAEEQLASAVASTDLAAIDQKQEGCDNFLDVFGYQNLKKHATIDQKPDGCHNFLDVFGYPNLKNIAA